MLFSYSAVVFPAQASQDDQWAPNTYASVLEKTMRDEAEKEIASQWLLPRREEMIEEKRPEKPGALEETTPFFIREIVLKGNSSIPAADFKSLLKAHTNKKITLKELSEVAQLIEDEYRRRDYLTAIVYVPGQNIQNDTITIEIVEGKFGSLYIEGNRYFSQGSVRRYWKINPGNIIRGESMVRSLLRMNQNPDRQVKLVLRPGKSQGLTDVYLTVEEKYPVHVGAVLDNQGSRTTGRYRPGLTFRHNNFIIPDSMLYVGGVFSNHFGAGYGQYQIPVNSYGTKLILGASASQVAPKRELKPFDINGTSQTYSSAVRHPWIETFTFLCNVEAGFDLKNSRTQSQSGLSRKDHYRVAHVGTDITQQDPRGVLYLSGQFSFGLDAFRATPPNNIFAGREGAYPDFFRFDGNVNRTYILNRTSQLAVISSFQLSPDRLPSTEQFYLGGSNSVRGYPESDYLADQGIAVSLEYLTRVPFLPKNFKLPRAKSALYDQLQLVLFFDEGYGRLHGSTATDMGARNLMSAGAGLRLNLDKNISARFELGHILGDEPLTESDHTRLHFKIQSES